MNRLKRSSLERMDLTLGESVVFFFLAILPSKLKVGFYKLKGAKIGRKVSIGFGSVIMAEDFSKISIGDFTVIRNFTIIICREVDIGKYAHIRMFVWIWGSGKLILKNKTQLSSRVRIDVRRNNFYLGEYSGLATGCIVYTHTHVFSYTHGWWHSLKDVVMEDFTFVGVNSVVLPGVTIGKNSVVGAGSVVTRSIPPNSFAAGSPAKVISGIDKFIDKVDSKELKKRTIEIAKDFVDYYGLKLLSEEDTGDVHVITFEHTKFWSRKIWHILVADAKKLDKKVFESYKEGNTILFSISEVPSKILKQVTLWYDLKNLKCCNLSNRFSINIWTFLYETWAVICDVQA